MPTNGWWGQHPEAFAATPRLETPETAMRRYVACSRACRVSRCSSPTRRASTPFYILVLDPLVGEAHSPSRRWTSKTYAMALLKTEVSRGGEAEYAQRWV